MKNGDKLRRTIHEDELTLKEDTIKLNKYIKK